MELLQHFIKNNCCCLGLVRFKKIKLDCLWNGGCCSFPAGHLNQKRLLQLNKFVVGGAWEIKAKQTDRTQESLRKNITAKQQRQRTLNLTNSLLIERDEIEKRYRKLVLPKVLLMERIGFSFKEGCCFSSVTTAANWITITISCCCIKSLELSFCCCSLSMMLLP